MFKFRTHTMNLCAAIWSSKSIEAKFTKLEMTDQHDRNGNVRMIFVMEVEDSKEKLDDWINDYYNESQLIEPLSYEYKLNLLRDNLKLSGGRR
jgi:hypothetical protein